jgi:hypothetical protein
MNDRQMQFSSITTTGRTSPVRPNLPVRYSSWGSRTEAEKSAGLLGEFNLALSNHDAAKWLDMMRKNPRGAFDLMRKNPRGAFDRCTDVQQASGKACSFVLWTEAPAAAR